MEKDYVELEAATIDEGLRKGARLLGVEPGSADAVVIRQGSRGLFGFSKPFKIKVFLKNKEATPLESASKEEVQIDKVQRIIEGKQGRYISTPEGLYLEFPHSDREAPAFSIDLAINELRQFGFREINEDLLRGIIRRGGKRHRIAPPQDRKLVMRSLIKVEERPATYDLRADGLYLLIDTASALEPNPENIAEELRLLGAIDISIDAVRNAAQSYSEPVRISPLPEERFLHDGKVTVEVSADERKGIVSVFPPFGGKLITCGDIEEELKRAGIVIEVDRDLLAELARFGAKSRASLVICEVSPEQGEDEKWEILIQQDSEMSSPRQKEDGTVDYKDLGIIHNVTKGELLARKISATGGKNGMSVRGRERPPIPGKKVPIPQGKGAVVSSDGMSLTAEIDGYTSVSSGKINVLPLYMVEGDVDYGTGNIDFNGSVLVRGNVTSGFAIHATGNVEILGSMQDGKIEADGSVVIKGGVYGRKEPTVTAGENVKVKFVENGMLKSKKDILIDDSALNSVLFAGGKIVVQGFKGLVIGGTLTAIDSVSAKVIGNYMESPTKIGVGITESAGDRIRELEKKIEQDSDNLDKIKVSLEYLNLQEREKGELPPKKKELYQKLHSTMTHILKQKEASMQEIESLEKDMEKSPHAAVSVSRTIYPGVTVAINGAALYTRDKMDRVTLYENEGEIKQRPYQG